jgi:hypothetical protein
MYAGIWWDLGLCAEIVAAYVQPYGCQDLIF